jgi:hypothetical protein
MNEKRDLLDLYKNEYQYYKKQKENADQENKQLLKKIEDFDKLVLKS